MLCYQEWRVFYTFTEKRLLFHEMLQSYGIKHFDDGTVYTMKEDSRFKTGFVLINYILSPVKFLIAYVQRQFTCFIWNL